MKFVSITQVKGLKIDEPVYTLDNTGAYGVAKLVSRTENGTGTSWLFEVPQYFNEAAPSINPVTTTAITHVCIMKNKKTADDATGTPE